MEISGGTRCSGMGAILFYSSYCVCFFSCYTRAFEFDSCLLCEKGATRAGFGVLIHDAAFRVAYRFCVDWTTGFVAGVRIRPRLLRVLMMFRRGWKAAEYDGEGGRWIQNPARLVLSG